MNPSALFASKVIRASRVRVFDAWTNPEAVKQWWGPPPYSCPNAEIDLRVGGEYRLANQHPSGEIIWISGRFEKVRLAEELVYTWQLSNDPAELTLLRVLFLDHPLGTEIQLHHEWFSSTASREEHLQGWEGCLGKLADFVVPWSL